VVYATNVTRHHVSIHASILFSISATATSAMNDQVTAAWMSAQVQRPTQHFLREMAALRMTESGCVIMTWQSEEP